MREEGVSVVRCTDIKGYSTMHSAHGPHYRSVSSFSKSKQHYLHVKMYLHATTKFKKKKKMYLRKNLHFFFKYKKKHWNCTSWKFYIFKIMLISSNWLFGLKKMKISIYSTDPVYSPIASLVYIVQTGIRQIFIWLYYN